MKRMPRNKLRSPELDHRRRDRRRMTSGRIYIITLRDLSAGKVCPDL